MRLEIGVLLFNKIYDALNYSMSIGGYEYFDLVPRRLNLIDANASLRVCAEWHDCCNIKVGSEVQYAAFYVNTALYYYW